MLELSRACQDPSVVKTKKFRSVFDFQTKKSVKEMQNILGTNMAFIRTAKICLLCL